MATRRKYKTRDDLVPVDAVAAADPAAAPVAASPDIAGDNPLQKALHAQGHAEELQRQSAQHQAVPTTQQQVAAHIDGLPISEFKKQFLRQHPEFLFEPLNRLMAHHYQIARHAGVPDDTEAMNQAILDGLQRDLDHHRQLTAAHARPTPENALAYHESGQAVQELQREAEGYLAEMAADQPAPVPKIARRAGLDHMSDYDLEKKRLRALTFRFVTFLTVL